MSLSRFLLYTSIGTVVWTALLAGAGWLLGNSYDQVSTYLDPVSNAIAVAILAWYLYRVATFRPNGRMRDTARNGKAARVPDAAKES
jgi:membrane protein DedA with SNARE-associated domain